MNATTQRCLGRAARVTIIQRILPHYRISFVRKLQQRLACADIDLRLVYGQERAGSVPRSVPIEADWATAVENRYWDMAGMECVWQPCLGFARESDLTIIEQSNRLLVNYLFQLRRACVNHLLAYWGHGRNMQSLQPDGLRERWKSVLTKHADWWFAYTDLSRDTLLQHGYPDDRITVVNNAIDDDELRSGLVDTRSALQLTRALGCTGNNIGLLCGGLTHEKQLDFVLNAACRIRAQIPDFELIVIGDGPDQHRVLEAAAKHAWIRYAGPITGARRAPFFQAARLLLMPGRIGLIAADSFVTECPIATTRHPFHSPEFAYLQSGVNSLVTAPSVPEYTSAVVAYLRDPELQARLREGCRNSAAAYSLDSMVERFAGGIESCLQGRS